MEKIYENLKMTKNVKNFYILIPEQNLTFSKSPKSANFSDPCRCGAVTAPLKIPCVAS